MTPAKTTLHIAPNLKLGQDFATKASAILAQRRKGKSYTAAVVAEECVDVRIPFAILDPTGAHWGLRASADGKSEGLPVVILGGEHGDLPLERTAGALVADLVLDHPGYYVIDMSLLGSKTAERRFAADFADRLYRRKGQPGMDFVFLLIVDEADMFVPQSLREKDDEGVGPRMLGAFESIVRRGGIRGLGVLLISQRAAVVNKNVLEQIDILIILRTVGPNDRNAVDEYVKAYASPEVRREVMDSLASLGIGEAWFYEPGADLLVNVQIRQRRTFNSSATPAAGQRKIEPTRLALVELDVIKEQMAETIERVKADDPKELRRQLAERDRRIRELEARPAATETVEVPVEVAVVPPLVGETLRAAIDQLRTTYEALELVRDVRADVEGLLGRLDDLPVGLPGGTPQRTERAPKPARARPEQARRPAPERTPQRAERPPSGDLTKPQQRVLDAIAWLVDVGFPEPSKQQVGFIAGYRVGKKVGGAYGNILGDLRSSGMIDYPSQGAVRLTSAGAAVATPPDIEPTTAGLQQAVMERLEGPEKRVLQVLIDAYPDPMDKQAVGEAAGYTVGPKVGGAFGNILGRLRTLGLIDYPRQGQAVATDILFLD